MIIKFHLSASRLETAERIHKHQLGLYMDVNSPRDVRGSVDTLWHTVGRFSYSL